MTGDELKALQAPLKEQYRDAPDSALVTLRAEGNIGEGVTCRVETGHALVEAGLHPATGGSGLNLCSGDMLRYCVVYQTLRQSPPIAVQALRQEQAT